MRRVHAINVKGRVGFGIAQRLGLAQDLPKVPSAVTHGGKYVIASAVQNAVDAGKAVAGQAFAHGLDNGDAPRHRRLEVQRHALGLRRTGQRRTVVGDQGFVGGHHILASGNGGFHRPFGRPGVATNQFDQDIDFIAAGHCHRIVVPGEGA